MQTSSPLPLPAYPSSDSLSISLESGGDLPLPPPPAPGTPPGAVSSHCKLNSSQSWGAEEQELMKTLALQHRNGSDASFKVSTLDSIYWTAYFSQAISRRDLKFQIILLK